MSGFFPDIRAAEGALQQEAFTRWQEMGDLRRRETWRWTPLDALREFANETLALVRSHPERFEALAAERSNCPSSENGGALGQMVRGEAVPEFEAALWRITPGTIAEALIETRYGLHIVRVNRRDEGRQLPFEQVHEAIAQALLAASRDAAWRQYVQVLLGRAKIEGIDLEGADTPLVQ